MVRCNTQAVAHAHRVAALWVTRSLRAAAAAFALFNAFAAQERWLPTASAVRSLRAANAAGVALAVVRLLCNTVDTLLMRNNGAVVRAVTRSVSAICGAVACAVTHGVSAMVQHL
jgi:hypothetical protein